MNIANQFTDFILKIVPRLFFLCSLIHVAFYICFLIIFVRSCVIMQDFCLGGSASVSVVVKYLYVLSVVLRLLENPNGNLKFIFFACHTFHDSLDDSWTGRSSIDHLSNQEEQDV